MNTYDYTRIIFGFSALMICLTCLLFTVIQQRTDKKNNQIYIALIYIVFFNALSEIGAGYMEALLFESNTYFLVYQTMVYTYFAVHTMLSPVFFAYVTTVCGVAFSKKSKMKIVYVAVFAVTELLALTNPLTSWLYTFDENRLFKRGWAEYIIYAAAAFYLVLAFLRLMSTWKALTEKRRSALFYFFFVVAAGILVQLVFNNIKVELFAEALGLMGIMLSVESEDERIDSDTGFYNRRALKLDLDGYILNKRPVQLIVLRITNADIILRTTGLENTDVLSGLVADYLRSAVPRAAVYNASTGTFVIAMTDKSEKEARDKAEELSRRFDSTWRLNDMDIMLKAVVLAAGLPSKQIAGARHAFYMIDAPLPKGNDKKVLTGDDLNYLIRHNAVEAAVSRGLEEKSFSVYYQPTYSMKDRKLHGAEALVRMHDRELGDIPPDEFIPVAEQMGIIDRIDDFVLEQVCAFIKSGIPAVHGMGSINVNLSVIECMRPGFAEHINMIVERSGIDKHFLNFEITESVAADDYELLSHVINTLKSSGFLFSMDDYGTGYSNMNALLSLNFDIIKIDKSLLRGAEQTELGRIMLENTVKMFKQMKRDVLVEGVETAEQAAILANLDVDYLQGYYFSRALCERDFVEFINK
ncbi:MAG: EAL domain-containing protein [Oscillospiraceae bacterium]|nr:EAL domain-containing protein [Oscillospiraceae bacterium]